MNSLVQDGKTYFPGVWYVVDKNFVFMLNENLTNKFNFSIYAGRHDNGDFATEDQVEVLANRLEEFLNSQNIGEWK